MAGPYNSTEAKLERSFVALLTAIAATQNRQLTAGVGKVDLTSERIQCIAKESRPGPYKSGNRIVTITIRTRSNKDDVAAAAFEADVQAIYDVVMDRDLIPSNLNNSELHVFLANEKAWRQYEEDDSYVVDMDFECHCAPSAIT